MREMIPLGNTPLQGGTFTPVTRDSAPDRDSNIVSCLGFNFMPSFIRLPSAAVRYVQSLQAYATYRHYNISARLD